MTDPDLDADAVLQGRSTAPTPPVSKGCASRVGCGCLVAEVAGFLFFGLFALFFIGLFAPFDLAIALVVGWAFYLYRVVPEVRVSWGGVALAVACLAAFTVGLHRFLKWLYGQVQTEKVLKPWPKRWTAALVGLVLVMFLAGIGAIGVIHQTGWLFTSKQSILDGQGGRTAARRSQSMNNLKQIGLALHFYLEEHGAFPPGGAFDATGRGLHGWQTHILPYIEQQALYNTINLALPWDDPHNAQPFQTVISSFLNPAVSYYVDGKPTSARNPAGYALSHYAGNVRVLGGGPGRSIEAIPDGASQTILAGEVAADFQPWGAPTNWRDPALGFGDAPDRFDSPWKTYHGPDAGVNMVFADGSVRWIRPTIDPRVLRALATPDGGETVNPTDY